VDPIRLIVAIIAVCLLAWASEEFIPAPFGWILAAIIILVAVLVGLRVLLGGPRGGPREPML
jgi:hypothetical protein